MSDPPSPRLGRGFGMEKQSKNEVQMGGWNTEDLIAADPPSPRLRRGFCVEKPIRD
jgi:hypothetical protein